MKITLNLKAWLVEKSLAKTEDDDAAIRKAASLALVADESDAGYLSPEKFAELSVDEKVTQATGVEALLKSMVDSQAAILQALKATGGAPAATIAPAVAAPAADVEDRRGVPSFLEKSLASAGKDGTSIKVHGAESQYSTTKTAALYPATITNGHGGAKAHPLAGQQARVYESKNLAADPYGSPRFLDVQSQLEKACIGAFWRWKMHTASKGQPIEIPMREHDWQLVQYALHEMPWSGICKNGNLTAEGSEDRGVTELRGDRKLMQHEIKALIDDATSGGLEAAPIAFDDAIILTPILYNELFPGVTVVPITRGRRIEGVQVSNPTVNSGGADDSDITLFTTTGMVTAFDTTIFGVDMGIELGLDFLSDSPINFESLFTGIYGQQMAQYLDRVIAVGNGTTEPEGIMSASGTTSVSFGNTTPTLGGYESLRFGVAKKFKQGFDPSRIVFAGTETSYMRARAIPVGSTDARRLLGENFMGTGGYNNYNLMEHRWAVNENMTNAQQFYAVLPRYRMYKRAGLTIKMTTEGKTLTRRNLMLITGRARWGGQLEDGGAASVTTTAQA